MRCAHRRLTVKPGHGGRGIDLVVPTSLEPSRASSTRWQSPGHRELKKPLSPKRFCPAGSRRSGPREWDHGRLRCSAPCAGGRHARRRCGPRHRHRCPKPRPATARARRRGLDAGSGGRAVGIPGGDQMDFFGARPGARGGRRGSISTSPMPDDIFRQAGPDAAQHQALAAPATRSWRKAWSCNRRRRYRGREVTVALLTPCCQHDDGAHCCGLPAVRAACGRLRCRRAGDSIRSSSTRSGFSSAAIQEGLFAVLRLQHAIAFAFQIVAQQGDQGAFVFDNKNGRVTHQCCASNGTAVFAGRLSALGRLLARCPALHHVIDHLGDIGGMIANALDVLGHEQQMGAEANGARDPQHPVGAKLRGTGCCRFRRSHRPGSSTASASSALWLE